ncbi:MAG TPA: PEGA domain-containing protein, partial [Gemmatimonadaceae bacterium]|nr:PEGA domain-containing protein [Gemmatimonadaceae bacterium]
FVGSMYLDSRPRGAKVFVDGKPMGETPMQIPEIRAGAHAVRFELAGHRPWSTSATVVAGQIARVTGSLERQP